MPEDTGQEPTYGEESGQKPYYDPGSEQGDGAEQGEDTVPAGGVDTGLPNEDLHGTAREVEEHADDPAETPGGG